MEKETKELTAEEAREELARLEAAQKASRPAALTLAELLNPEGLSVLGVALIERAFNILPRVGSFGLLASIWAWRNQENSNALTLGDEDVIRQAAALAARIPAAEMGEWTRKAERLIDSLPGRVGWIYEIVAPPPNAKPPEGDRNLLGVLEAGAELELRDGSTWRNTTRRRLLIRKLLEGEADMGGQEGNGETTASSSLPLDAISLGGRSTTPSTNPQGG